MKPDLKQTSLLCEFRENSAHFLARGQGWDFPIERDERGQLTPACIQSLVHNLGSVLHRHGWSASRRVLCSIPARGISLRAISVPAAAQQEPRELLALQIEAQFPLSPGELAWGYLPLEPHAARDPALRSFLVAAVKTEILEPYRQVFRQLQLEPAFTVAALARLNLPNTPSHSARILDVGEEKSELVTRDPSGAVQLRVLPWGSAHASETNPLTNLLQNNGAPAPLLLTGVDLPLGSLASQLSISLSKPVEVLPLENGPGRTAANLGLQNRLADSTGTFLCLNPPGAEKETRVSRDEWKWAAAAVILLLLLFAARYLEPLIQKPRLARELAALKSYRAGLPQIERELGFLEFIKTNQPPCLDAISVLAHSAPRGLRLESLSIGRRGDVSLRGKVNNPDGANQFRSKLVDSGFFSRVVVEEQTPEQNRREVKFRITAELKPDGRRPPVPDPPPPSARPGPTSARPMPGSPMPGGPMPSGPIPSGLMPARPMPGSPMSGSPMPIPPGRS